MFKICLNLLFLFTPKLYEIGPFLHSWKCHTKNDRRGSTPRVLTLQSVRAVQFLWWWHSGSYDMRETSCESDSTKKNSFRMEISSFSGFGFQQTKYEQKKIKKKITIHILLDLTMIL